MSEYNNYCFHCAYLHVKFIVR